MMMGTADEIVKAPEKGPVFIEDLPEDELVLAVVRFLLCLFKCQEFVFRKFHPRAHLIVIIN